MKSVVLFCVLFLLTVSNVSCLLSISFNVTHSSNVEVLVDGQVQVEVIFEGTKDELDKLRTDNWTVIYEQSRNLEAEFLNSVYCDDFRCIREINIKGIFLGFGKIWIAHQDPETRSWKKQDPFLEVAILRQNTIWNKIFIAFVAIVVSFNYINMGCALDLVVVKEVLRRPIGPIIGGFCQFVVMPLVSYGVGLLVFEDPVLRLGLFTFGSSPGGGASNMWTVILSGNLNLSITMTFISTLAALGTIPLWLFTLGKTIVDGTSIVVPFKNILISLASLTIPIGIGLLIQRKFPKVAARSKRLLAPVCIVLLICIIVLASVANSYIFFMLTWRMVIAASLSVWTGFAAGVLVSFAFRLSRADIVAISVETGIQNSGIAFLLLSYSLKPPVSDMASVVPVAASIITPVPLFIIYCYQKCWNRCHKSEDFELKAINSKSKLSGAVNLAHSDNEE